MDHDLAYIKAGLELLEPYLLSQSIYWPIQMKPPVGEPPFPSLTLGGLLLARLKLEGVLIPGDLSGEVERIKAEMGRIYLGWRVAWEQKASREFQARLKLWRDFLEDYRANPAGQSDRYAYEVSRRVMLELLQPYAVQVSSAEFDLLKGLDNLLKEILIAGDFIWDKLQAPAFPIKTYWYLYGRLR
jgi:hypothetical protein